MEKLEFNDVVLVPLSQKALCKVDGGMVGFNWGMYWKGFKIGIGIGATAATVAYVAYA